MAMAGLRRVYSNDRSKVVAAAQYLLDNSLLSNLSRKAIPSAWSLHENFATLRGRKGGGSWEVCNCCLISSSGTDG